MTQRTGRTVYRRYCHVCGIWIFTLLPDQHKGYTVFGVAFRPAATAVRSRRLDGGNHYVCDRCDEVAS